MDIYFRIYFFFLNTKQEVSTHPTKVLYIREFELEKVTHLPGEDPFLMNEFGKYI